MRPRQDGIAEDQTQLGHAASAKTDLASDPPALRADASAGYSAFHASCAS